MYKLLLSWRYLCTRYIALASVVSVTLGVTTLIVVNSVMAGFAQEMHGRLHGILSDIVLEAHSLDGYPDPQWHMDQIQRVAGEDIEGMTAIVHVPALMRIPFRGDWHTRQINLIGVDRATYAKVSDCAQYLQHPENRQQLDFILREYGYAPKRDNFPVSGWRHRRMRVGYERALEEQRRKYEEAQQAAAGPPEPGGESVAADASPGADPYSIDPYADPDGTTEENVFDPMTQQHTGVILGIATCSVRMRNADGEVEDFFLARPGDDVRIMFPNAGTRTPKPIEWSFTVTDLYESKMSEYDSTFAFMPLDVLQDLRGMIDPTTGVASVTSIQLKLKDGADLNGVRDRLRAAFPPDRFPFQVQTWRDLQGPLLAAVQLETTILNILLFLIIAVAGFGILATFFMIVVEKTRDIGIMKALGAPSQGVMSIFLGYGVSLGAVGAGVGMVAGLLFVFNINEIAGWIEYCMGVEVFDPTVYYFDTIPTSVSPTMVVFVMIGATAIAVLASVLPALRAARLHPVEALRYE